MNQIEQTLGSQKIRLGSDGNGLFIAAQMRNGRYEVFTTVEDIAICKPGILREHGDRAYGLMMAYIAGESEMPAYAGANGYIMASQVSAES